MAFCPRESDVNAYMVHHDIVLLKFCATLNHCLFESVERIWYDEDGRPLKLEKWCMTCDLRNTLIFGGLSQLMSAVPCHCPSTQHIFAMEYCPTWFYSFSTTDSLWSPTAVPTGNPAPLHLPWFLIPEAFGEDLARATPANLYIRRGPCHLHYHFARQTLCRPPQRNEGERARR